MKNTFRTAYNGLQAKNRTEKGGGKSQTTQGEAYSIQELMVRAVAQGQIISASDGLFIDADIDNITAMYRNDLDIHDLQTLREYTKNLADKITTQIQKENKQKQEEELFKKQEEKAQKDYDLKQVKDAQKVTENEQTD